MAKRLTANDMEKREFYQMPKWIYEIKGLKSLHREIYMLALNNYNLSRNNGWINEKGEVYFKLSYATLVNFTGARRETINKAIRLLVEIGLLEAEKKNGTATKYFITEPEIDEIKEKYQSKTSTKKRTSTENSTGTKNSTATSTEKRIGDQYEKPYPNKNNTNRLNKNNINNSILNELNLILREVKLDIKPDKIIKAGRGIDIDTLKKYINAFKHKGPGYVIAAIRDRYELPNPGIKSISIEELVNNFEISEETSREVLRDLANRVLSDYECGIDPCPVDTFNDKSQGYPRELVEEYRSKLLKFVA